MTKARLLDFGGHCRACGCNPCAKLMMRLAASASKVHLSFEAMLSFKANAGPTPEPQIEALP